MTDADAKRLEQIRQHQLRLADDGDVLFLIVQIDRLQARLDALSKLFLRVQSILDEKNP